MSTNISCRQSSNLVCTTRIPLFKKTTVLCTFACHQISFFFPFFFMIVGIILDDIMPQLTRSKHSFFRAVDGFQGNDITQSRWVPPRIVSLSHMPQLHDHCVYEWLRSCLCVCVCVRARMQAVCVFKCLWPFKLSLQSITRKWLVWTILLQKKPNYRVWVKVRIGVGIAGKSWSELVPCGRRKTRGVAEGC